VATLQPVLLQDPKNGEIRRILAYDQRAIGELLDDLGQRPAALAEEREALASLVQLAGADPANAQLQQDIACARSRIGMLLTELGEPRSAIGELEQAAAVLQKTQAADVPQSYYGFKLLVTQLWLGKAHVALASAAQLSPAEKERQCHEARSWFERSQPGFEALRDKGADYDAAEALESMRREGVRCAS